MRWSLVAVRMCMIIVSLVAVLIIVLTTVPLARGGLEFDFPDDGDDIWEMQGNRITGTLPIGIKNGGYFDIEDFSFRLNLTDNDGFKLVDVVTEPVDLVAGKWTEVVVNMSFNLDDLPPEKQFEIVFNGTDASLAIGLTSYFGLKTMKLSIDIHDDEQSIEIPPMISEMNIDPSMLQLIQTSDGYQLLLPYSFSASDMISGEELSIHMSIGNATRNFGDDTVQIMLDHFTQGELTFPLSQETFDHLSVNSDTLYISTIITFVGISMEREFTYDWTPFIKNFQITSINTYYTGYDGQIDLGYSFDSSDPLLYQNVAVHVTVRDEFGTISTGEDHFTIYSSNYRYVQMFVTNEVMNRLYGSPDDWTITFDITGEDFTTTKTMTYHWNGGA